MKSCPRKLATLPVKPQDSSSRNVPVGPANVTLPVAAASISSVSPAAMVWAA